MSKQNPYRTLALEPNSPLVKNLLKKKELLEKGDETHVKIKTALIVASGAMKGAYASGVLSALHQLGLDDVFDDAITVSSGGISCCYFLSSQGNIAPEIFYKYLADKKFINVLKAPRVKQIVGIDYGYNVFRTIKPFDQDAVRNSRSNFYMAVTNAETGKGELLNVKEYPDIVEVLHASSAVPILYWKKAMINGKQYYDGNISCTIPVDFALQQECNNVLIILNDPIGKLSLTANPSPFSDIVFKLFKFHPNSQLLHVIHNIKNNYFEKLQIALEAKNNGINIGIIAPEKIHITSLSINKKRLKETADEATKQTMALFS